MDALLRRRAMMAAGGGSPTPPAPTPEYHSYLVFDGIASIQTDIVLPTNGSLLVSIGGETVKGAQGIINAANIATGDITFALWMNNSSNTSKRVFSCRYNSATTDSNHPESNDTWDRRVGIFITPTKWGYGIITSTHTQGNKIADGGLLISYDAYGVYYTGKLGQIRIYDSSAQNATDYEDLRDNYTALITLKPCVLNGECGFYDEAAGKFYGNTAGAGTLSVAD